LPAPVAMPRCVSSALQGGHRGYALSLPRLGVHPPVLTIVARDLRRDKAATMIVLGTIRWLTCLIPPAPAALPLYANRPVSKFEYLPA